MADGYAYKAKINGEWVDINFIESPAELTAKLEKNEEWAKVVRCKDCRYYRQEDGLCLRNEDNAWRWFGGFWEAEDYCSHGERREDGKAD